MTDERRLSWEELQAFIGLPDPSSHAFPGQPEVQLMVAPLGGSLRIRVPVDEAAGPSQLPVSLSRVKTAESRIGGRRYFDVWTEAPHLYSDFFSLACSVVDRIQSEGLSPWDALEASVRSWRDLVQRASMLSDDKQLGLRGELSVLRMLTEAVGREALSAWVGPLGAAHDFRIGTTELEVKTTRSETRNHAISSMLQLVASPDAHLYVISLQYTVAGAEAGTTLGEDLAAAEDALAAHGRGDEFRRLINNAFAIEWEDLPRYESRLKPRANPVAVYVDPDFPRVTQQDISKLPYRETHRLSDVQFRIDLTGLGEEMVNPDQLLDLLRSAGREHV